MRRALVAAVVLAGCHGSQAAADAGPAPSAAAPPAEAARLDAIVRAEERRAASEITPDDQQSRDPRVRRAAARGLARIGADASRPALVRALADEDEETATWAAYGLGFACKGHEEENVSALAAEAVTTRGPNVLDAIARAVGRCAAETSEPTLAAWLAAPRERAAAAAFALGDVAGVKKKLREETFVALLNAAAGSAAMPPIPETLYPATRLENVPPSVVDRLREVATARLAEAGPARVFAVRALGRAGVAAAPELARVLGAPDRFTPAERADAARALKRLEKAGQKALGDALAALAPRSDPVALTGLVGEDFGVLLTVLESMTGPGDGAARKALRDLAALPMPPGAPPAVSTRVVWLRCDTAALLAGDDFKDPLLTGCDPRPPAGGKGDVAIGPRAIVGVLGRGRLSGARLTAWRALATLGPLRAREAAIELLATHPEVDDSAALLEAALGAPETGLVATAAEVIAKQPQRASDATVPKKKHKKKNEPVIVGGPSAGVIKALLAALAAPASEGDPEMLGSVVDAAGALALKEADGRLRDLCKSSWPTLREHAQGALVALTGDKKVACDPPPGGGEIPAELGAVPPGPPKLVFATDAGELSLTLDPTVAPAATARLVELAKSGWFDGIVVHRVVPGFVTQAGAPLGDGYGGPASKPPLRCETSPRAYEVGSVGIALAGRDTGSSQFFVTHARQPHLDGGYAWIGTAEGPWAALVDGDVLRKVTVAAP